MLTIEEDPVSVCIWLEVPRTSIWSINLVEWERFYGIPVEIECKADVTLRLFFWIKECLSLNGTPFIIETLPDNSDGALYGIRFGHPATNWREWLWQILTT